jgi:exosome complex protein LRP1
MDPQTDLPDLVEDLEVNIDELTTILAPLLTTQLSTTASSLPLLDKAKLYVLAAYSIESLLYSSLQASGTNARDHAVFKELARLKAYFGKIKSIEDKLDVGAAARFIKHGLAGNDKYDLERAERQAKERARAHLKARLVNKKFNDEGEEAVPKKRDIADVVTPEAATPPPAEPSTKKAKLGSPEGMDVDSSAPASTRKSKRGKKKSASEEDGEGSEVSQEQEQEQSERPKRKTRGGKKKDGEGVGRKTRSAGAVEEVEGEGEKPKRGKGRPRGKGKGTA